MRQTLIIQLANMTAELHMTCVMMLVGLYRMYPVCSECDDNDDADLCLVGVDLSIQMRS